MSISVDFFKDSLEAGQPSAGEKEAAKLMNAVFIRAPAIIKIGYAPLPI